MVFGFINIDSESNMDLFVCIDFNSHMPFSQKQEQETSYTILRARGTNVTITGLKPDTTYIFQIRARTAAGYGSNSRKFEFETSPDCTYLNILYINLKCNIYSNLMLACVSYN